MIVKMLTDRESKIIINSSRKNEMVIMAKLKADLSIAEKLENNGLVEVRARSPYVFRVRATGAGRRYSRPIKSNADVSRPHTRRTSSAVPSRLRATGVLGAHAPSDFGGFNCSANSQPTEELNWLTIYGGVAELK